MSTPLSQFVGPILYHEHKVDIGTAEIISNPAMLEGTHEKAEYLYNITAQNPRVSTNRGFDIAVAFHPNEKLSDLEMSTIGQAVLNKLDMSNCAFVIYRHYDKPHGHFHIVTTSVDIDGKKISEYQINTRAKKAAIALEKEFSLRHTVRSKKSLTENDYQVHNYSIARAISKINPNDEILGIKASLLKDLSLVQIRNEFGLKKTDELYKHLSNKNLITKSERQSLTDEVKRLRKDGMGDIQITKTLDKKGYYARLLSTGEVVLKNPEGKYYYKLSELEKQHSFDPIKPSRKPITKDQSKEYTKRIALRYFNKSKNIEDFISKCAKANIQVSFVTYKDGKAYGINFTNTGSGIQYKGSQIGLSFSDVVNKLRSASKINTPYYPSLAKKAKRIADKFGYLLEQNDEDKKKQR